MTEINGIYNALASYETLAYVASAAVGGFALSVVIFFYNEWREYKKTEENKIK